MPTQSTTYNSRVTDEALEKRFRDTFRSQGGAELVDDLYAQGVIVPIVDFTAAATGQQLAQNLQTAWDLSTEYSNVVNTTTNLITTPGFWQVDLTIGAIFLSSGGGSFTLNLSDGFSSREVYKLNTVQTSSTNQPVVVESASFVVFVRSGDTLSAVSTNSTTQGDVWYRQIAAVNGDLVNPTGFTSS